MDSFKKLFGGKKHITLEEYISNRKKQGASQEEIMREVLEQFSQVAFGKPFDGEIDLSGVSKEPKYKWACSRLSQACEKCIVRHGQIHTWEEWEKLGMF